MNARCRVLAVEASARRRAIASNRASEKEQKVNEVVATITLHKGDEAVIVEPGSEADTLFRASGFVDREDAKPSRRTPRVAEAQDPQPEE